MLANRDIHNSKWKATETVLRMLKPVDTGGKLNKSKVYYSTTAICLYLKFCFLAFLKIADITFKVFDHSYECTVFRSISELISMTRKY